MNQEVPGWRLASGLGEKRLTDKSVAPKQPMTAPSAPEGPMEISDIQETSFVLSWKPNKGDGGSPIQHYAVEKRGSKETGWTYVNRVKPNFTKYQMVHLTEGSSYHVRVKTENNIGQSEPVENDDIITLKSPVNPPSKPLSEGTEYMFRVMAENDEGLSQPLESKEPVSPQKAPVKPAAPGDELRASSLTQSSVTLNWLAPSDDGGLPLKHYIIEAYDSETKNWATVADVPANTTQKTTMGLQEGLRYEFRVLAENSMGRSKPTHWISLSYQQLMQRLNKVHITMSDSSKRNLIKELGEALEENLIKDICSGKNGKFNGDNLDIKVSTNDIRMTNRDKHYHFFASNFVIDRVIPEIPAVPEAPAVFASDLDIDINKFILSDTESAVYKDSLKVLLGRIMAEHIPAFHWFSKVIPGHIPHLYQEEMAKPSTIHSLPLSLNNECSYEGCLKILQEYTEWINKWYRKAGRANGLEELQVAVGGDQLTRVRFQGAKALRAGCHTIQERLDQLNPIIIELFHTLQDFLEKMCKKFLKLNQRRDVGTLANLKVEIQRSNVNGNVKSRFKAHEDFIMSVGHSYFLTYIMEKFNMANLSDKPVHGAVPDNMTNLHMTRKKEIFDTLLNEILTDLYIPFKSQDPSQINISVQIGGQSFDVLSNVAEQIVTVPILINNNLFNIQISLSRAREGCVVSVNGMELYMKCADQDHGHQDDLHNYVVNYLQWYFVILQFQDTVHEGDITRTNIILKTMIPYFYSHSALSKYFTECIDYILKTEITLPPDSALRVRAASFVNVHGGDGKNKAADMHKENKVKLLKDLIRGLGANKTENSIVAISKAAPVIQHIVQNYDTMLLIKKLHTSHKKRSSEEDIQAMIRVLKKNSPWICKQRSLNSFKGFKKSPFSFELPLFRLTVKNTVKRLLRDIPLPLEDYEDNDDDNDDELQENSEDSDAFSSDEED